MSRLSCDSWDDVPIELRPVDCRRSDRRGDALSGLMRIASIRLGCWRRRPTQRHDRSKGGDAQTGARQSVIDHGEDRHRANRFEDGIRAATRRRRGAIGLTIGIIGKVYLVRQLFRAGSPF